MIVKRLFSFVVRIVTVVFVSLSLMTFQNCSKVLFSKEPPQEYSYTLESQIEQQKGLPLNLVLIVDGSNSMSPLKESFKKKVTDFLKSISKFNVRIGLSSINDQPGAYLKSYSVNGETQFGALDLVKLQAMQVGTSIESHFQHTFLNPDGINIQRGSTAKEFFFQSDMNELDRENNLLNMKNRIENMFVSGSLGGGDDQAFCQILTDLDDITSHPNKYSTHSATIFMVLSNEDDESNFPQMGQNTSIDTSDCVKIKKSKAVVSQTKSQNYISLSSCYAVINVKASVDGAPSDVSVGIQINFPYDNKRKENVDTCGDILNLSASKEKIKLQLNAQFLAWTGYSVLSSVVKYTRHTDFSGTQTCSQLAAQYQNSEVVPNSCGLIQSIHSIPGVDNFNPESLHASFDSTEVINNDFPLAIANKLKTSNGISEQFYFSFLINPTSGVCGPLVNGARVGEKYQKLATELGVQAEVYPLCDLSKVGFSILKNASDYVDRFYLNKVKMPVSSLEMVDRIEVIRNDGSMVQPTPGDYKQDGDILVFNVGYLNVGDQVKIFLKDDE